MGMMYTKTQAADLLGCPRPLVGFLIASRGIPVVTVGKRQILDQAGLEMLSEAVEEHKRAEAAVAVRSSPVPAAN